VVNFFRPKKTTLTPQQLARACRRLGWIGLVLQIMLGVGPLLVVITQVLLNLGRWQMTSFSAGLWLAVVCLLLLLFSIYWCFRYISVARRLDSQDLRPAKSEVKRILSIGLLTNLIIMALSVLIALWRVSELTWKMLLLPQGATVISPGQTATTMTQGALITPSNMIAIHAMISAIAAGLVGAIVALILIAQVAKHRPPADAFS